MNFRRSAYIPWEVAREKTRRSQRKEEEEEDEEIRCGVSILRNEEHSNGGNDMWAQHNLVFCNSNNKAKVTQQHGYY